MINRRLLEPQCKVQQFIIFNQSSQCLKSVCYMTDYFPHLRTSLSLASVTSVYCNLFSASYSSFWAHFLVDTSDCNDQVSY